MSLRVIRKDLLEVKCEAIVDPSDVYLSGSGSLDYRIHKACGSLLEEELETLDGINVAEAVLTKSYELKTCKYIIHTAGPIYYDGKQNEFEKLRECYRNILLTVKENKIKSVAIPLISTGTFCFPKKDAFNIAIEEINEFLLENKISVNLVIYDNESFNISKELSIKVKSYIKDNLIPEPNYRPYTLQQPYYDKFYEEDFSISNSETNDEEPIIEQKYSKIQYSISDTLTPKINIDSVVNKEHKDNLKEVSANYKKRTFELDESFSEAILRIIDEKGLKDPDVYKKAGIDRKLFSSLRSKKNYVPSKKTAISLCIALELNIKQTDNILKKAGYSLSHSKMFDVIIEYFIKNKIYDVYEINVALLDNDQELLGC